MKQAYKKRPPRATANSPPLLADMGKLFYKSEVISLVKKAEFIMIVHLLSLILYFLRLLSSKYMLRIIIFVTS
jgi:hypothetical protein